MLETISGAISSAFQFLWNLLLELCRPLLDAALSLIPSWNFDISFISGSFWALLNEWFPINYAIGCTVTYLSIALAVYTVNWILGLIPTVS